MKEIRVINDWRTGCKFAFTYLEFSVIPFSDVEQGIRVLKGNDLKIIINLMNPDDKNW